VKKQEIILHKAGNSLERHINYWPGMKIQHNKVNVFLTQVMSALTTGCHPALNHIIF